ncbi:MAG: hypothetical protein JRE88_10270 [Deltaproteobacteria bacterium]|nr:hypothetical protein [Deltaproteobacteria bacterium]MBW2486591.1 hypothetical protein [Deltaproteobacteria bacterium]MBW2517155.1 hypothetical protein [Deltaproteobacteria bacterium]
MSVVLFKQEEKIPWAQMGAYRIEADQDQEMTGGRIINPIPVSRGGPVKIAEKVLTAEAAWQDAEPPGAGIKTVAGTDPASNAVTYFED